jgi:peroxiredoxin
MNAPTAKRILVLLSAAVLAVAWPALPAPAGKFNAALDVGDPAPAWGDLPGIDDRRHSLEDYAGARLIVLVFTCNHSPCAVEYEPRLAALQRDYRSAGVQVVAINVNRAAADSLPRMKERAAAAGFEFPYLYDDSQQSARAYGAAVTPEVFVLDAQRRIAYQGRIDDQLDERRVKRRYLRAALDALLAGEAPAAKETLPQGCAIQYE